MAGQEVEGLLRSYLSFEGLSFEFLCSSRGLRRISISENLPSGPLRRPDPFLEENLILALSGRPYQVPRLDLKGLTPFRRLVLEASKEIPFGMIITYKELAFQIGLPRATRAVGQALGWNPVPIFYP